MPSNSSTDNKLLKRRQHLIQFHITQKAIDGWECLNSLNIERRINRKFSVNYSFIHNQYVNSNIIKLSINL